MPLMDDKTREDVREMLKVLTNPVKMVVFTQEFECQLCAETRQIAEEVAELSDQITLDVRDFVGDETYAKDLHVDKIPAIVLLGENDQDYGIRFFGIPSGYEFMSLLEGLKLVSSGQAELEADTQAYLDALEGELHLQVFVTPTCPYCPSAVILAHRLAFASEKVRSDMVEANEFPHLSMRYNVMGVPRTVINEDTFIEGAAPEQMLLDKLQEAMAG
ncbi:MAG: thioredoxin family protein [Anaerolineae bacterium]|nr:thioredoxin family protein [Anaerolineae bacterium]